MKPENAPNPVAGFMKLEPAADPNAPNEDVPPKGDDVEGCDGCVIVADVVDEDCPNDPNILFVAFPWVEEDAVESPSDNPPNPPSVLLSSAFSTSGDPESLF